MYADLTLGATASQLRNEFEFWNVHGIMNISGLLQSLIMNTSDLLQS